MPASYNIETYFLRCQHIFRWPPSPSLEPVSNYLHSEWGNHTTFAQPPSPFRPRSGVVPIPPLFPDRYRTISERGTRFEWQERKTERLVVADRSALVRDRSGHFPQHWWSFRLRSIKRRPSRSEIKRLWKETNFCFCRKWENSLTPILNLGMNILTVTGQTWF